MHNTVSGRFSKRETGIWKIIAVIMIILTLICSCKLNNVRVDITKNEQETDSEIICVEIPQIKGMGEEFTTGINNELKAYADEKINIFTAEAQRTKTERDNKAKLTTDWKVYYNKKNFLSAVGNSFSYTSGITGAESRLALNIDTKAEKRLYLCDLFNDDEYIDMLNARLATISQKEEYADIWEQPVIGEEQNECFYLTDDGLVIYYPPYELSYYARGFVEFVIPYSELYGYLKPEYVLLYKG